MSERFSHWATGLSAIISALVFVFSLYKYWSDSNQEKVSDWQKVAVYEYVLKSKGADFSQIKIGYITEAQQISSFEIPRTQIQDDSLRKVLIELQASKLIFLKNDGKYLPTLVFSKPDQHVYMQEMIKILKSQREEIELMPKLKVKILDLVSNECGKYTQDALYREVSSKINVSMPVFFNVLHGMRGVELHLMDDQTWCPTYDSAKE
ncbi:hypothetical protein Q9881_004600 [Vibrio parahaemolyticus]|nr:hypothetical protein [Vibrio parahaemolyticus]EGR2205854.1 hypothetical protein [Vibrio parahaemolyticus]EHH1251731.1 hypothetical protein [Vibrio parahaemolyticus]EJG0669545.1 hypothetical protein [Vibrio parahaemolyticus]ELA7299504.1 hypothetical protein [Vibrio parahaemolyticus]